MKKLIICLATLYSQVILAANSKTILYLGDSHSDGRFGATIDKNLSSVSDHVIMEASCGSTPLTWLGNNKFEKTICGFWKKDGDNETRTKEHLVPRLSDELAIYHPEITIIQLGTNIAAGEKPKNYSSSIVTMMKMIKENDSRCIWLGPPDALSKIVTKAKLQETNELLTNLASQNNCYYIDNLKLTKFPVESKEGIHYPPNLAAQWGELAAKEILKIISSIAE